MRLFKVVPAVLALLAFSSFGAETAPSNLTLVGKGIRTKKVFLFNVDVYEAQFLVSDRVAFVKSLSSMTPLEDVAKMDKAELRMKFMRSVSSSKIKESFLDALHANKVNAKAPNMVSFLKTIEESPSFDEGKTVILKADFKANTLKFVDTNGKETSMQVGAGDIRNVFSIWFGTPADGGLETLKDALIGKAT